MSQFTNGTAWTASFTKDEIISISKTKLITIPTSGKYLDKDIKITIPAVDGVNVTAPSTGENVFYVEVPNGTSDTIKYYFHVTDDSNVYITDSSTAIS